MLSTRSWLHGPANPRESFYPLLRSATSLPATFSWPLHHLQMHKHGGFYGVPVLRGLLLTQQSVTA